MLIVPKVTFLVPTNERLSSSSSSSLLSLRTEKEKQTFGEYKRETVRFKCFLIIERAEKECGNVKNIQHQRDFSWELFKSLMKMQSRSRAEEYLCNSTKNEKFDSICSRLSDQRVSLRIVDSIIEWFLRSNFDSLPIEIECNKSRFTENASLCCCWFFPTLAANRKTFNSTLNRIFFFFFWFFFACFRLWQFCNLSKIHRSVHREEVEASILKISREIVEVEKSFQFHVF